MQQTLIMIVPMAVVQPKKLVAGMHNLLVYIMDIDVASQLTNVSFQFGSAGFLVKIVEAFLKFPCIWIKT